MIYCGKDTRKAMANGARGLVLIQERLTSSVRTCETTWFSKQDPPCYVTGRWAAGKQRETAARAWLVGRTQVSMLMPRSCKHFKVAKALLHLLIRGVLGQSTLFSNIVQEWN